MKKKYVCILTVGLTLAALTACSNAQNAQTPESQTYGINPTSTEEGAEKDSRDSEYEISDMLPRPSDDTLIMSVEEAEKYMKNKANIYSDTDSETE